MSSLIFTTNACGADARGEEKPDDGPAKKNCLTVYFSCSGNTRAVAEKIAGITGGDIYRIVPETPYMAADLDYNTDCRANREQNDPAARPAIDGRVENMSDYDTVFLGYPIWWSIAPRIISTFLESYDFAGKTVVPFCTSGSSGVGSSDTNLHASTPKAVWKAGRRFRGNETEADIRQWIEKSMR